MVTALAALIVGCGDDSSSGGKSGGGPDSRALREAQADWRRQPLHSYQYRIERQCFCLPKARGPTRITVRDGRPRGTPEDFKDADTVPELFDEVKELLPSDELSVRYDGRGVPRRIEADAVLDGSDDEITYLITGFRPVR